MVLSHFYPTLSSGHSMYLKGLISRKSLMHLRENEVVYATDFSKFCNSVEVEEKDYHLHPVVLGT